VRAILEDALDAVDAVGERAEGELRGFVSRLEKQRGVLRKSVHLDAPAPEAEAAPDAPLVCPGGDAAAIDGAYAFQAVVLASAQRCAACGLDLGPGVRAHRALFDDPARRAFLGPGCRLLPVAKETEP
jgi:hypothetical protein